MDISTKASTALLVRNLLQNSPAPKIAGDSVRLARCSNALRRSVKKYLGELTDIEELIAVIRSEYNESTEDLRKQFNKEEDETMKKGLQEQLEEAMAPFNVKLKEHTKRQKEIADSMKKGKVNVKFDAEDYVWLKKFVDENGASLCQLFRQMGDTREAVGVSLDQLEEIMAFVHPDDYKDTQDEEEKTVQDFIAKTE